MKKTALLLSATLAITASAIDYVWLGTVDSNWQNSANWNTPPGAPPWNTAVGISTNHIHIRNRPVGGHPLVYSANEGDIH